MQAATTTDMYAQQPHRHEGEHQHFLVQQTKAGPNTLAAMSLETYMDIRKALTKGDSCVQSVPAAERAMYKLTDLRQVTRAACLSSMQRGPAGR